MEENYTKYFFAIPDELEILNKDGFSPLDYAVRSDENDMVQYLLDCKANPNFQSKKSKTTPLILAINKNSLSMVTLLLKYQANINTPDENRNSPLHHAIKMTINSQYFDEEILDIILAQNPEKDLPDKIEGNTPLHLATKAGRFDLVKKLLPLLPNNQQEYMSDTSD